MKKLRPLKDSFQQLKADWYKKLEDDGFEDIEQDEDNLKVWSSALSRERDSYQQKAEYFRLTEQFLAEHEFKNKLEKSVWEKHSQGLTIREIETSLKFKSTKKKKSAIWLIVDRLKNLMKNKYLVSDDKDVNEQH